MSRPPASDFVAACAVRTLARTETFMPMKPGGAGQDGADREPDRHRPRKQKPKRNEHDDADAGDGRVLAPQIGLRPFRHRAGNLLHARCAGVRRHQAINRVDAVDNGKQSTDDNQAQKHARKPRFKAAGASPAARWWRLLPETALRRNGVGGFQFGFKANAALRRIAMGKPPGNFG